LGRPHDFFRAGVQYYVHGRQALLLGHESVAGSLFHQGFELMCKAALLAPIYARHSSGWETGTKAMRKAAVDAYTQEADRYLRRLGHDLEKIWTEFRKSRPMKGRGSLRAFDRAIRELNRWWTVRYPGFPEGVGLSIKTLIVDNPSPARRKRGEYELPLETMDRLFALIAPMDYTLHAIRLAIGGRRPNGPGIAIYELQNRHPLW